MCSNVPRNRYNVISNPLEGKLTMPKAIFMTLLIWCYTIPWAIFPLLEIWGRFVPGKPINAELVIILIYNSFLLGWHRGLFDRMLLRLFNRYIRQSVICCGYIHLQLLHSDAVDSLLLQSDCSARIQSWEGIAGPGNNIIRSDNKTNWNSRDIWSWEFDIIPCCRQRKWMWNHCDQIQHQQPRPKCVSRRRPSPFASYM